LYDEGKEPIRRGSLEIQEREGGIDGPKGKGRQPIRNIGEDVVSSPSLDTWSSVSGGMEVKKGGGMEVFGWPLQISC
jgi:hypothetical protein